MTIKRANSTSIVNIWLILLQLTFEFCNCSPRKANPIDRVSEHHVSYSIEENCPVGTEIGSLGDLNATQTEEKIYFVPGTNSSLFAVHPNLGIVSTIGNVDSEALCNPATKARTLFPAEQSALICPPEGNTIIVWIVNAFTQANTLKIIFRISIEIQDVDDNAPQFQQQTWYKKLKELLYNEGKKIVIPKATDVDIAKENNRIQYRLEQENFSVSLYNIPFTLDFNTFGQPLLVITQDLDAEERQHYHFYLVAYSNGTMRRDSKRSAKGEAWLPMHIEVEDANDNEPRFASNLFEVAVSEATEIGTVIIQLVAHDADVTAKLTYRLHQHRENDNNLFKIDALGNIRLHGKLDYEFKQAHLLKVEANDGEFKATTELRVSVIDVNDEPPEFVMNPGRLEVDENVESGKFLAQLRIHDKDKQTDHTAIKCWEPRDRQNEQIVRFIPSATTTETLVYDVVTRLKLDRETANDDQLNSRLIYFICSDAQQGQTVTWSETVTIRDVNDHVPRFTQKTYTATILEDNKVGAFITQVHATDEDEGENANVTYYTLDEANFNIDARTGSITSKVIFDREARETFLVTILARDGGTPMLTSEAFLNLTIGDINDNLPHIIPASNRLELTDKNVFTVMENFPANTFVGKIEANDLDIGENALMSFELIRKSEYADQFHLNPNGTLYTKESLDREKQNLYNLTVCVRDHGTPFSLSTTGMIHVWVLDENDNAPVFRNPPELLPLVSDGWNLPINSTTHQMPRDQPVSNATQEIYNLTEDVTHPKSIPVSVWESIGFIVTQLEATDLDEMENSTILFSLKSVTDNQMDDTLATSESILTVDEIEGFIVISKSMNVSDIGRHCYIVCASDQGLGAQRNEKMLCISVEDIPPKNDNYPYYTKSNKFLLKQHESNNSKLKFMAIIISCSLIFVLIASLGALLWFYRSEVPKARMKFIVEPPKATRTTLKPFSDAYAGETRNQTTSGTRTFNFSDVERDFMASDANRHDYQKAIGTKFINSGGEIDKNIDFKSNQLQSIPLLNARDSSGSPPMRMSLNDNDFGIAISSVQPWPSTNDGSIIIFPANSFHMCAPLQARSVINPEFFYNVCTRELESDSGHGCSDEERFCDLKKSTFQL